MKPRKLKKILANHKRWLNGSGGSRADLRGADLQNIDLRNDCLQDANLRDVILQGTDLFGVDLRNADLRGADLDFSCWPLWCGSLGVRIGDKLARQLAYHALAAMSDIQRKKFIADPIKFANKFHRVGEVPKLKGGE